MAQGNESALRSSMMIKGRETMMANENVMLMDTEEATADFVTPYAIRNLTERTISVKSLKPRGVAS